MKTKYKIKNLLRSLILFLAFSSSINFAKANPVDTVTAKIIAKNFYFEMASMKKTIKYSEIQLSLAEMRKENDTAVYYVFNENNYGGYVIVTADNDVLPILGYSLDGVYSNINPPPAYVDWMNNYMEQIIYVKRNSLKADSNITAKWNKYFSQPTVQGPSKPGVGPLLTSIWDQSPYYNNLCPGGSLTGCVATAMGQVMRYWGYDMGYLFPYQGIGSHTDNNPNTISNYGNLTVDFCSEYYDWGNMPNALNINSSQIQINAVATLLYDCGISVDMNYSPSGSGAWNSGSPIVANAFINYFGYSSYAVDILKSDYYDSDWKNYLVNELNNGRPMMYGGSGTGGHAFVCDGYQTSDYFHFNWGWSGSQNGDFYLSNLNPGTYNFTNDQEAVINIMPGAYISLYSDFILTPDPIIQGQSLDVDVDLVNYGADNFDGSIFLGLYDLSGNFVETVESISSTSLTASYYSSYTFSSSNISAAPGYYYLYLFYMKNGTTCWIQSPENSYSNPLLVQVIEPVYADFSANTTSICVGGSVDFTDLSAGSPTSWSWDFGDGGTSAIQDPTHVFNTAGTYDVTLTVSNGGSSDAYTITSYITVIAMPSTPTTPSGTTTLCVNAANTNYTTTATQGATTYSWSITPSGAGTITGSGTTGTVDWNNTFTGTATITVKGYNSNCGYGPSSAGLTATINPLPSTAATPTGLTPLCQDAANTNYTTTGAANATSYQWSISPVSAGTISGTSFTGTVNWDAAFTGAATITVMGKNSCGNGTSSAGLTVTVNPKPAASAGSDQYITSGQPATLTASGGTIFLWSNGGNTQSITVYPTVTTTYTVTVSNSFGCSATDDATVYVTGGTLSVVASANPTVICSGSSSQLSANPTGGNGTYTYSWVSNPAGFTSTLPNPTVTPTASTTYTVTVTSGGSTASSSVAVTVNPSPPVPTISLNGSLLTSSASSGNQWYYNGSIIPGATAQTYNTTQNGAYYVVVTVGGCSSTSNIINIGAPPVQPFFPELLSTAGDYNVYGNTTLSWSIGECLTETNTGTQSIITQGFHQPDYLIVMLSEMPGSAYSFNVFPNPTSDNITVEVTSPSRENFKINLLDVQGKLLLTSKLNTEEKSGKINLGEYARGLYFLSIYGESGELIKSYMVQKVK